MLRVVTAHQPPLVFVNEAADGTANYTGFLVDLLPMLLESAGLPLNFFMFHLPPAQAVAGVQLRNGSWTGIMGQLTSKQADVALYPLTLTAERAQYIQHTQPFADGGYGIVVKAQEVNTGYSFLLPFSWQVWLLFLVSMLVVVLLLTCMDIATRKDRCAALAKLNSRKGRKREKLMGHAIETIMMTVNSGAAPASRSLGVKLLFIAWAIFSVIMLSTYTANLTTGLTVNQLAVPVSSLADLAQTSAYFGVPADSAISQYFLSSMDNDAMMLRPRMVPYTSSQAAVEDVRRGKIAAFVTGRVNAMYYAEVPPCNLALASEVVGSGSLVFGLQPNSTIAGKLNAAMLRLADSGHVPGLRRKWFQDRSECSKVASTDGGRLGLAQTWSVFVIPAVGAAVGILVAAAEVLYYNKLYVGVQALRHDLGVMGTKQALARWLRHHNDSITKSLRFGDVVFCRRPAPLDVECPAASHKPPCGKDMSDGSGSSRTATQTQQQQQQQQQLQHHGPERT